jgi:membrane protein DedA with SNARE-associated domain
MEDLIKQYGLVILFIGALTEGETILVMAGFLAHQGYFHLSSVILAAFLGTLLADQFFYYLGYVKGFSLLEKRARWKKKYDRVTALLTRYQTPVIIGFRFLYGLRTITPFVIGLSKVKPARFLVLNAIGALVWASTVGFLGYSLGNVLELYLEKIRSYEIWILGVIATAGFLAWLIHFRGGGRSQKPPKP